MKHLFQLQKLSPVVQFLFFLMFFFIGLQAQAIIISLFDLNEVNQQLATNNVLAKMVLVQLVGFILPVIAFIYLLPHNILSFFPLKKMDKNTDWLWLLVLGIGTVLLVMGLGQIMSYWEFGADADNLQSARKATESAALQMNNWADLCVRLIVMALLPAIGEELFFRGIFQRFVNTLVKNIPLAIVVTAAVFASFHGSIYNFTPVMIGGIILGYVYFKSGNILYNIVLHFIINGVQILMTYYQLKNATANPVNTTEMLPIAIVFLVFGIIIVTAIFKYFFKGKSTLGQFWVMPFEKPNFVK